MSLRSRTLLSITALAALAACSPESSPPAPTRASASRNNDATTGLSMRLEHARVCPGAAPGEARCHSLVRVDDSGRPLTTSGPSGYGPADLRAAYNLAATGGA